MDSWERFKLKRTIKSLGKQIINKAVFTLALEMVSWPSERRVLPE